MQKYQRVIIASPKQATECDVNVTTSLESNKQFEDGVVPPNPTIVLKEPTNKARLIASEEVTDGDEDGEEYQIG